MRVLAALHLYAPHHNAGAEGMVHAMLKALVVRGHQVSVQLSMPHPMFCVAPYVYEGVSVWPFARPDALWRWCTSEQPPDLLLTHLDTALAASCVAQLTGIPLIQVMHNTHDRSKQQLARGAALAVFNTEWMRADFQAWGPVPRHLVLYPPIDRETYRSTPGNRITLINLTEAKGAEVFYALAQRLPRRRFLGVRGAYGEQIIRTDLPNVEIIPHVAAHDMAQLVYSRTRVLLAPSSYESYGRVTVEAACSGIPSIAHPTPGLLEALGDGGTFCDRDDLDAWVAALSRLVGKAWTAASQRARAVADRLDTDADLQRWAELAEEVAGVPASVGAAV